jgi:hypothetical protein
MSKINRWPAALYSDAGDCQTFNSADDVPKKGGWAYFPVGHARRGEDRSAPLSGKSGKSGKIKRWPAWCVGPDGQEAIFKTADEVPDKWSLKRAPAKAAPKPAPKPAPKEKVTDARTAGISDKDAEEVIMTKAEAMDALAANSIEFDAKAKKLELVKLILWAIDEGKIEAE